MNLLNGRQWGKRYITGLDGLRAFAVIGVLLFHLMPTKVVGGWLGVPLFFVISGYLITDLLVQEFDKDQYIGTYQFYLRRLRRLYPALVVMLIVTTIVILLFTPDLQYNLRYVVLTNLFYVYNFWSISHGESYFQQFGGASPFTHLWSLSIEGQFYLVWPFIINFLLKHRVKRRVISIGLAFMAVVSALLMALLYQPDMINRVYYGTDTRLFAILLGTALAFMWPSDRLSHFIDQQSKQRLNIIGAVALVLMIFGILYINGQHPSTYYGMMFLFTLIATVLIAIVVHPASIWSQWLDNGFLNYLGKRSYSIYLYQLPVFVFYERLIPHFRPNMWHNVIELILVLLLSEVSYRYIEQPFRKGTDFQNIWYWLTASRNRFFGTGIVSIIMIFFVAQGLTSHRAGISMPKTHLQKELSRNQERIAQQNKVAEQQNQLKGAGPRQHIKKQPLTQNDLKMIKKYQLKKADYQIFKALNFKAVGDSVMLDTAPYLQEINNHFIVDAKVGRQTHDAVSIVGNWSDTDNLAPNILVGIGTNGTIKQQELEQMMQSFGRKRQVFWVNSYVPNRPWQDENNQLLKKANRQYKNLHVIDWYSKAKQHPEWFASDGVHPEPEGNRQYVRLLVETTAAIYHD